VVEASQNRSSEGSYEALAGQPWRHRQSALRLARSENWAQEALAGINGWVRPEMSGSKSPNLLE
jgi:hypothetical protein